MTAAEHVRAALALLAVALLGTGCSALDWQRAAYEAGDQYACRAANESRHDEALQDARCTDLTRERVGFEDYQAARAGEP